MDFVSHAYALAVSAYAGRDLGAGPAQLGYLGTAFMGAYAIGCMVFGGWSDRMGSRALMAGSLCFLGAAVVPGTVLGALAGSLVLLCLASAAYGMTVALFWPSLLRQLSLWSPGATLWRSVGAFNVSWAVGTSLGYLVGPAAVSAWGLGPALWVLLPGVAVSMAAVVIPARGGAGGGDAGDTRSLDPARGVRFLRTARIANFVASFAMGGGSYVFLYVGMRHGISLEMVGLILAARDTGRLVSFYALRAFSGWHYSLPWLIGTQVVGGAALVVSGFASRSGEFIVLFFVLGLFAGLAYYSSLYYGLNLRTGEGRKSGNHEAILAIGFCLGPLCCGAVGDWVPSWPGAVLVFPGAVILLATLVEALAAREPRAD
jgi:predicted MFS family arabinose efflux permease